MIRHQDGFDGYNTASLLEKYTQLYSAATGSPSIGAHGRFGTNAIRFDANAVDVKPVAKVLVGFSGDTCIVQHALTVTGSFSNMKHGVIGLNDPANLGPNTGNALFYLRQGGTTQVYWKINADGTVSFYSTSNSLLATTSAALNTGTNYLKVKVVIHGSAGTIDTDLNGNQQSFTGLDTQGSGSATVSEIVFGKNSAGSPNQVIWDIDDLIVMDGTGGEYDDFVADHHASYLPPTGAGFYQDSTPSEATRLEGVDETPADGDTSVNDLADPDDRDSFTFNGWPASGVIGFVALEMQARREGSGSATAQLFRRASSTDYDDANEHTLLDAYFRYERIMTTDPSTSSAWAAGITPEFGVEKTA